MKEFLYFPCLLLFLVNYLSANRELLREYINFENYKKERDIVYKIVYNYRNLDKAHRAKIIDDLHHKYHASGLALILHNVGLLKPMTLREKVEMIPNSFFNPRKGDYFDEDLEFKEEYKVSEEFGKFLDEIETKYDHVKAHDDYYEKVIFSPEGIEKKMSMLMYLQQNNKTDYLEDPMKAKNDTEFLKKYRTERRPQMTHYTESDRKKYEKYLSQYYESVFRRHEDRVKEKSYEHHTHYEEAKAGKHQTKPRPHSDHYIANLTKLKDNLPHMEAEIEKNITALVNHSKKHNRPHHHHKLVSYLQLQEHSGMSLASRTETLAQTLEKNGQCPMPMPPPELDDQIKESKAKAELVVLDVEEDEAGSKTLLASIIMMIIKLIIAIIKMIIQLIIAIIAGFLRQCIPPGPLTIFSCPEGGVWRENLYHPVQFDEKTFALWEKAKGFPFYYSNLLWNILKKRYTVIKYYICGQGFFTLDCSVLWPKCFDISYIITNPPVMGNPLLIALTLLDWLVLLPGDCPFCFLTCIQVMLQCDIPWERISTCYGIYNMELPMAMGMDPSLAIYCGLSMAPPFCTYNPFIVLIWILKPPPEIPDEFFPKEIPTLKEYQKAVGNAIKGECMSGKSGWSKNDEGNWVVTERREPAQTEEERRYGQGGYYKAGWAGGSGSGGYGGSGGGDGSGDEYLRTTHPRIVPSHSYNVINWEKYLTDPDNVRKSEYLSDLKIGQGENVLIPSEIARITKEAEELANKIWKEKKDNHNGPFAANEEQFKKGIVHEQLEAAKALSEAHPTQPQTIPISSTPSGDQSHPSGPPGDSEGELEKVAQQGPTGRYNIPGDGKEVRTVSGHFGDEGLPFNK